jgi:hypothetical protein
MSENSSINTLIGTFSSIDGLNNRTIVSNNLVCIDTANNRIGINTIEPSCSIAIIDNGSASNGIYTPRIYFDLTRLLATTRTDAAIGQVYVENEVLKVKTSQ